MEIPLHTSRSTGAEVGEAGRLDSWKEIASFFKREVRTVQLWEQHEHLPVHRHQHRKVGTVHAYKAELGEWWKRRCEAGSARDSATKRPEPVGSNVTQITLSIVPFESSLKLSGSAFAKTLKEQVGADLNGLLPPRFQVVCSLTAAQRHALGSKTIESDQLPNADYLLDGSLEDTRTGLRVHLRIASGKSRSAFWSHSFEFDEPQQGEHVELADQHKIHVALAESVSRVLSNHVLIAPQMLKKHDIVPEARYAYLRGRYYWSQRSSAASIFNALQQFRLATEADPHHAAALSGMADCYAVLGWLGAIPRETAMMEARSAASRAMALDPSLAECHVSMGCILFDFDWDWDGAEREMLRGIDLNPSYAQAYCWYGQILVSQGRCLEAVEATRVAQYMETSSPIVALFLGSAFFHAGQYDSAIQQFEHVLHMQPDHAMAHSWLGLSYEHVGDLRPALAHLEFVAGRSSNDLGVRAMLSYVHARSGERLRAEALLNSALAQSRESYLPVLDAAAAFTALEDHEAAIDYLSAGFDQRNLRLTNLKSDPRLFPLHTDTRFISLTQKMRLD